MTRRLIHTETVLNRTAKVYRDAEWEEYRVIFFKDGKKVPGTVHGLTTDYHTDDKQDAYLMAIVWAWDQPDLEPHTTAIRNRVVKFAKDNGAEWKEELFQAWWDGTDANLPDGHLLRIARNRLGPEWLKTFNPYQLS